MAMARREHQLHQLPDWPGFMLPDRWRRLFDLDPEQGGWLRTEEYRDGDTVVVRAEVPGIDPEKDVQITVSDGVLSIRARREMKDEQKNKEGYRSEFRYGELSRTMRLPEGVSADDVKATYENGILKVVVPVPADKGPDVKTVRVTKA